MYIIGGVAQKAAVARALYKDAPVVILDEPTCALDPISEVEISENFNYLNKKNCYRLMYTQNPGHVKI